MAKTYAIEKKTPNSNWYTIHSGLDADTAVTMLADIIFAYESMADVDDTVGDYKAMFTRQLGAQGYASTTVDDGEAGERGDDIGYRIVEED